MPTFKQLQDHPDAAWLLQERLLAIRGDTDEKMEIRKALVRICFAGGDRVSGRRHLEGAYQQALRMDDAEQARTLRQRLALHLLSIGLPTLADPLLRESLLAAVDADDTLMVVALGSSLSAMRLEDADWSEAQKLGALVVSAASRRGNWPGVADGLITQATCLLKSTDSIAEAIALLLHGGKHLNSLGASAAVNLIKARLGEIRALIGPERFDVELAHALLRLSEDVQDSSAR